MTTTTIERIDGSAFYRIKQDRFWLEVHYKDLRPIGEAILDGLEAFAESAVTSTTEHMKTTVAIRPNGKVRLSQPRARAGLTEDERYLLIVPTDAVDLANEMLSVAAE